MENIGGTSKYRKDIVCPDGCVIFRLTAKKLGNENFYKGKFLSSYDAINTYISSFVSLFTNETPTPFHYVGVSSTDQI